MVVAVGALFLSVGGNVTAAVLITSADIRDNTIRSVDIHDETIRGADVANNSLTGSDVVESSLGLVPSAGKVDGLDANSLTRVARMGTTNDLVLTHADKPYGPALRLTAPRAGFVMIHGSTTIFNTGCAVDCGVVARLRHVQSGTSSMPAEESIAPGQVSANISHAWVFPVKAGVNTFRITIGRRGSDGILAGAFGELAAVYSPFGPMGTDTLPTAAVARNTKTPEGN
jgi:hypothetical protein